VAEAPSHDALLKVRKLALLPDEARHSTFAISVTRLTTLKSLCQEPQRANRCTGGVPPKPTSSASSA
jgi:hypothetical protein